MTKTVWITRTLPAADVSAEVWREVGFDPLILPLLEVVPAAHEDVPQTTVVIFTSKNGIDHFTGQNLQKKKGHRAVCVGDATAEHARSAGFRDVISVNGTSSDVTAWVLANLSKAQAVTHISGRHIRGTIVEDLCEAGYSATRMKVYESKPILTWPEQRPDLVALYSPLAAQTFRMACSKREYQHIKAISISAATDAKLDGLELARRMIADRPTEAALVKAAANP